MTIVATNSASGPYIANGVTTAFPYTFAAFENDEVAVAIDGVTVSTSLYTVTRNAGDEGGTVTFLVAPVNGVAVVPYMLPSFGQDISFTNAGPFLASSHDEALDRAAQRSIYLESVTARSLRAPPGEALDDMPPADVRAGMFPVFDGDGQLTVSSGTGADASLRNDLAAAGGSALSAFAQSGAGATTRSVQSKLRDAIHPRDFGATGDGIVDDRAALTAAFTAAAAIGLFVDGGGLTYGIAGTYTMPATVRLRNTTLKLTNTSAGDYRVAYQTSGTVCHFENVKVDRGATATIGTLGESAGIWIDTTSGVRLVNCEVTGHGKGSGIALIDVTDSAIINPVIHDMTFDEAAAVDDRIQGIWLERCTNVQIVAPTVRNLNNAVGGSFPNRYTRGIIFGGCYRCSIVDPKIRDVDQGVDLTGELGNRSCTITGGHFYQCNTYGVKLANSAYGCKVVGVIAERCGSSCFVVSGPSGAGFTYKTQDNDFIGCTAIDAGYNGFAATNCGFRVMQSGFDTDFPKGTTFVSCRALDRQTVKTMDNGFYGDVTYDATAKKPNRLIDCRSEGHLNAERVGFHRPVSHVSGTVTASVPNAAATAVDWDVENDDSMAMHSTSANIDKVYVDKPGLWRITAQATFASNSTGYRKAQLYLNGVAVTGASDIRSAVNGDETVVSVIHTVDVSALPAAYNLVVTQNSGGALNLERTKSFLRAERLD